MIAWRLLKPDVLLYFDIQSRYAEVEKVNINRFSRIMKAHVQIETNLKWLGETELQNSHVPLRNLQFLLQSSYIKTSMDDLVINLGALKGEGSRDKTKKFRRRTEWLLNTLWSDEALGLSSKRVEVRFPFKHLTKTGLVKKFIEQFGDEEFDKIRQLAISCYSGSAQACGRCNACFRRWVAEVNNISVPRASLYYEDIPYYFGIKQKRQKESEGELSWLFRRDFWRTFWANVDAMQAFSKYQAWAKKEGIGF